VKSDSPTPADRPLRIDLLTLFPAMVEGFFKESILGRAVDKGILQINTHNLRDWAKNKHRRVDDTPFGGGAGMLMSPQPLFDAIEEIRTPGARVVYLCPDGKPLTNTLARELAGAPHLVLVSGHYEGMDQRVRDALITDEVSIGDYVLTNGTIAAAVLVDCLARQIPGVLGDEQSLVGESFCEQDRMLSHPQYTRPAEFRGLKVPEVLLGGNHKAIAAWNKERRIEKTLARRPDLLPADFAQTLAAAQVPVKKKKAKPAPDTASSAPPPA
jgi:tRNA (guanine37-N1)-methyltransferase